MRNNKKDKFENLLGKYLNEQKRLDEKYHKANRELRKRTIGLRNENADNKELSHEYYEESSKLAHGKSEETFKLIEKFNLDCRKNAENWAKYMRFIGHGAHNKVNVKHCRNTKKKLFCTTARNKYRKFNSKLDDMIDEIKEV